MLSSLNVGDREAAVDLLGPVLERGGRHWLETLAHDPELASLHDHPRLQAMVAAAEAREAGAKPAD